MRKYILYKLVLSLLATIVWVIIYFFDLVDIDYLFTYGLGGLIMTYLLCIFLSSKEEFIKFLKRILVATLIVLLVVLLVVPLSLLGLLFLIMFIQWLFFSYDDDFNIPENYFDRMYEDKEINSPENGLKEWVKYHYGILSDDIEVDGVSDENNLIKGGVIEDIEKISDKLPEIEKPKFNSGYSSSEYYVGKYECRIENNCRDLNRFIEVNDEEKIKDFFAFNGEYFVREAKYFEEKYKLFEKIKEKEYIKSADGIYPSAISSISLSIMSESVMSEIALMYIENGEYEKGIDILLKQREIIDVIDEKMYINSLTITWIQIDKSIINYSAIEYVLNNYDIPKELLEKLLAELQKSIREGIAIEASKGSYKNYKDIVENPGILKNTYGMEFFFPDYTFPEVGISLNPSLILTLFYSKKETIVLSKKMRYDWIEADKEILNNGTLVSEKGMPKFLFKSGDITDEEKFVIKNINNLIGRNIIIDFINLQWLNHIEKQNLIKRAELVQKLQEKIEEAK